MSISKVLSVFNREGAEGMATKIINEENSHKFSYALGFLKQEEHGLIICYKDLDNWVMITTERLLIMDKGMELFFSYSDIRTVDPAFQEEFKAGVRSVSDFTKLKLIDKTGGNHIITIEKGKPYQGLFQAIDFIYRQNRRTK
ncbi:hypothetical protein [Mucilaginibacter sp. OK283]|uniref:hypothetical protein n=1 Tax=Mucilaginibacter sp. OK283 TaxID=1881049 RepID=UPI0008BA4516|nr:hypothetical protein [Mucilaginibacter sp. OK283]SEO61392.1 hypothetical protein SAMN05428947_103131 [Mucilaginibacter sp. OK283]